MLTACLLIVVLTAKWSGSIASAQSERIFIPMGGSEDNQLGEFVSQVVNQAADTPIRILILPLTMGVRPTDIEQAQRIHADTASKALQSEMEKSCNNLTSQKEACSIEIALILTRSEANQVTLDQHFTRGLSAVYFPEGDPEVAMQILRDSRLERLLLEAYQAGVVISGSGSGATILAKSMLAGYQQGFGRSSSLDFGAVKISSGEHRGLAFGIEDLVIEPHFFQRGRLSRLLNAISAPESPAIGLGIDASSGVQLRDERFLENSFGSYGVTILDADTYHASEMVSYQGTHNRLRLRNVLIHMLAPGDFTYDLQRREHSLASPSRIVNRSFDSVVVPAGAGEIILSSKLSGTLRDSPILNQFLNLSRGRQARIAVVLTDPFDPDRGDELEQALRAALPVYSEFIFPTDDPSQTLVLPAGTTGIILVGEDQAAGSIAQLESIKVAWLNGTPLLAIDAGSAFVGSDYSASPQVPDDEQEAGPVTHGSLEHESMPISTGLGLLQVSIEPNLLSNNRWGRLFSLAYHHSDSIAIGMSEGSALLVDQAGGRVLGENITVVLDLRNAALDQGSNRVFVIANGLLDVFVPGDRIEALEANMNSDPLRLATPVLSTPTPVSRATQLPGKNASKTLIAADSTRFPRITPSPTPTEVIEITDPRYLQSMVLLGTVSVLVILIGVWRNRSTK